ncbi:AbrB/MazE/SpoVT family DNA-binding domain-containing protein [Rahnella sikkimica]|uniref:Antitoxin n=1 Tax=Rahnella sikkimica TaxID=1805933 RepID=A0A2L1UYF5_9GAMM|nr:antitoxin [Rahnella sikkimica]AVF37986.1 antitoxin [Rahnella sikkimica]
MQTVKLRQQGGAMIVTIPRDYATSAGWTVGTEITVKRQGTELSLSPTTRSPRGAFTIAELLGQIDREEIASLNNSVKEFTSAAPTGKEYW